jgi:hypothetical protein
MGAAGGPAMTLLFFANFLPIDTSHSSLILGTLGVFVKRFFPFATAKTANP